MKNVRLRWTLPTTRDDDSQLPAENIAHVRIESSVNPSALGWTVINTFQPDILEYLVVELDHGTWHFRSIVVDTAGNESEAFEITVAIAQAKPRKTPTFEATVE